MKIRKQCLRHKIFLQSLASGVPPRHHAQQTHSLGAAFAHSPIAAHAHAAPAHATRDPPRPRGPPCPGQHVLTRDENDYDSNHRHHLDCHRHLCGRKWQKRQADQSGGGAAQWRGARATARNERRARAVAAPMRIRQRTTTTRQRQMKTRKKSGRQWECAQTENNECK